MKGHGTTCHLQFLPPEAGEGTRRDKTPLLRARRQRQLCTHWIIWQGIGCEQMMQFLLPTKKGTNRKCLTKLNLCATHLVVYKTAQQLEYTKCAWDMVFGDSIWNLKEGMDGYLTHTHGLGNMFLTAIHKDLWVSLTPMKANFLTIQAVMF